MKRKQIIALLLASVLLLLCLSGCSSTDYQLSKYELDQMLADAKAEGYEEGLEEGRSETESEHSGDYDNGYSEGYDAGHSEGYKSGCQDTVSDYENRLESCRENYYQYGYDDGYKAAGGYIAPQSSTTTQDEPAPAQETTPTAATYDYIINTNTGKFHYTWCKSVGKMAEKNKWYYTGTRDSVVAMGYVPCKNCNP